MLVKLTDVRDMLAKVSALDWSQFGSGGAGCALDAVARELDQVPVIVVPEGLAFRLDSRFHDSAAYAQAAAFLRDIGE